MLLPCCGCLGGVGTDGKAAPGRLGRYEVPPGRPRSFDLTHLNCELAQQERPKTTASGRGCSPPLIKPISARLAPHGAPTLKHGRLDSHFAVADAITPCNISGSQPAQLVHDASNSRKRLDVWTSGPSSDRRHIDSQAAEYAAKACFDPLIGQRQWLGNPLMGPSAAGGRQGVSVSCSPTFSPFSDYATDRCSAKPRSADPGSSATPPLRSRQPVWLG